MYNRPILVEFASKEDAEYLLTNRTYLPRGIFIDREYSKETEAKRKFFDLTLEQQENYRDIVGNVNLMVINSS